MLRPLTVGFAIVMIAYGIFLIIYGVSLASARDPDGQYDKMNPQLHAWFDQLASGKGLCCSFADGVSVADVDWSADGDHYKVRLDGKWIDVPPEAVVKDPNKFGPAVVWPYREYEGTETKIRCFLPGAGA